MDPMSGDPTYVRLRHAELLAAAAEHRLARTCRRWRRPPLALRVYTRLWWAGRPRVTAWAPALLDPADPRC